MSDKSSLPDKDDYYMGIAKAVRARANCLGKKVGAVIVVEDRIVSTGYNGTPDAMKNCFDGGCPRCKRRGTMFAPSAGYDICYCVHAEQNAILSAARHGISVSGATIYTTIEPCIGCLKEIRQIESTKIVYEEPFVYLDAGYQKAYEALKNTVGIPLEQLGALPPTNQGQLPLDPAR